MCDMLLLALVEVSLVQFSSAVRVRYTMTDYLISSRV